MLIGECVITVNIGKRNLASRCCVGQEEYCLTHFGFYFRNKRNKNLYFIIHWGRNCPFSNLLMKKKKKKKTGRNSPLLFYLFIFFFFNNQGLLVVCLICITMLFLFIPLNIKVRNNQYSKSWELRCRCLALQEDRGTVRVLGKWGGSGGGGGGDGGGGRCPLWREGGGSGLSETEIWDDVS